jgi:adenosine deaminase
VALGFVPSWPEHPLPRLREAGLAVTLNTDIPISSAATLTGEYEMAGKSFGYSDEVLAELALASVAASFAPERTKRRLRAGIAHWLAEDR